MNTDKLSTILSALTALFATGATIASQFGAPQYAVGLGALAAATHVAAGYVTNKPSTSGS